MTKRHLMLGQPCGLCSLITTVSSRRTSGDSGGVTLNSHEKKEPALRAVCCFDDNHSLETSTLPATNTAPENGPKPKSGHHPITMKTLKNIKNYDAMTLHERLSGAEKSAARSRF